MISEADKKTIRDIAKKYHIKRVLLFGSCLCPDKESNDIDIAIEGIPPLNFYKFYGDLLFALPKPVDIIDFSNNSKSIGKTTKLSLLGIWIVTLLVAIFFGTRQFMNSAYDGTVTNSQEIHYITTDTFGNKNG